MKYCTNCGTQLLDEAKYCSSCGAKLNGSDSKNIVSAKNNTSGSANSGRTLPRKNMTLSCILLCLFILFLIMRFPWSQNKPLVAQMAGFAGMLFGSAVIVWISSLLVHFIAKKIYKKLIFDKISALNVALTICLILNASSFVYLLVNIKHDSSQSPKMLTTNAVPPAAINWGTFQPDDKSYAVSVPYGSNDGVDMREIDCAQHCHGYPDITLQDLYSNLPVGDYHLMTVYSVPFLKLLEGHFYEISRYHQVSSEKFTDTNKHLLYIYDAMKKTIVGNNTPKFSRAIIHESKPDVYADGYLDYLYLVDGDNGGSHFSVWEMGRIFIRGDDVYILKNSDTNFDLLLTNIDDYKKFVNSFSTNISAP